jgi:hypothetical protein
LGAQEPLYADRSERRQFRVSLALHVQCFTRQSVRLSLLPGALDRLQTAQDQFRVLEGESANGLECAGDRPETKSATRRSCRTTSPANSTSISSKASSPATTNKATDTTPALQTETPSELPARIAFGAG